MNRCHWRAGPLLLCPLRLHVTFCLSFECVTREHVSVHAMKRRFVTTATEKRLASGWLAQQDNLTVSILSCWVYVRRDLASRSVQPFLRRKWRISWPPRVSEMRGSQLTVSLFTLFGELLCYLYIVFLHCYGLRVSCWVSLLVYQHVLVLFIVFDQIQWIHWH